MGGARPYISGWCKLCRSHRRRGRYLKYEKSKPKPKRRPVSRHEGKKVELLYDPGEDGEERWGFRRGARFSIEALQLGIKDRSWTPRTIFRVSEGGKVGTGKYIVRSTEKGLELCLVSELNVVGVAPFFSHRSVFLSGKLRRGGSCGVYCVGGV